METTTTKSPTGKTQPRRIHRKSAQEALLLGDVAGAADILRELVKAQPADLDFRVLLFRSLTELGAWAEAEKTLEGIRSSSESPDLSSVLAAELSLSRGDSADAMESLRDAPAGNIVTPALLGLVEFFTTGKSRGQGAGAKGDSKQPFPVPTYSVWFESVFAHALFFVETRIETLIEKPKKLADAHRARTHLFRPEFRPGLFKNPSPGIWDRTLGRLRSARKTARIEREREVVRSLIDGKQAEAADQLRRWLSDDADAFGADPKSLADPRRELLVEVLFSDNRFDEVIKEARRDKADDIDAGLLVLVAYAELALGKNKKARETLEESFADSRPSTEAAHILGLTHLRESRPEKAIGWFRRMFRLGDVDAVELLSSELDLIGVKF